MTDVGEVREASDEDPLAKVVEKAMDMMREEVQELGGNPDNVACVVFLLEDIMNGDATDAVVAHHLPTGAPHHAPLQIALDGCRALAKGLGIELNILPIPVGMVKGEG